MSSQRSSHSNSWHRNVLWPRREGLLWLLEASWEGVILHYHTDFKHMDTQSWQVLRRQGWARCFTGSRLSDRRLKTRANVSSELQGYSVVGWYGSVRQPPLSSTLCENSVLFVVATTTITNSRLWCFDMVTAGYLFQGDMNARFVVWEVMARESCVLKIRTEPTCPCLPSPFSIHCHRSEALGSFLGLQSTSFDGDFGSYSSLPLRKE